MKRIIKQIIGTQNEWESHIDIIFDIFNQNLKTFRPDNMLDVGSGSGERSIRIAKYLHIKMNNIYGVDIDKEKVIEANKIINAKRMDLEADRLPFENEMFDLVICNQVLEHLKNYKKVIEEILRVTRVDGYIVLGIPNLAHLINRIYLLIGLQPMCIHLNGPHVRSFTHKAFLRLLSRNGRIKIIDSKGTLMYPLPFILSKLSSKYFTGLCGYTCYLLKKTR